MKKIRVIHLFGNSGLCTDVFHTVGSPRRYYNRNMVSGVWYTSTPDTYENDCHIRQDVSIEVVAGKQVLALDGNGDFEGKKPFVPFCYFEKEVAKSFSEQRPNLRSYEEMKAKILSLPGGKAYTDWHCCWENWVFNLDSRKEIERIVDTASWMGLEHHILALQCTHKPTGFVFTNYRLRAAFRPERSASYDLLLYDWQDGNLNAAALDQDGTKN